MGIIVTIIKLLFILLAVTTIHEFGHFLMAKLFKIGVDEFSIGFGPKIFQKKVKDTMYSLRWIPLGGYCAIVGEGEESQREDSFEKKEAWKKVIVLAMGVIFNAVLAFLIFIGISFSGKIENTTIKGFSSNSPAKEAGLEIGDAIYSINGKRVRLYSDLYSLNADDNMSSVQVVYIRDGKKYTAVLENTLKKIGNLGIAYVKNEDGTYSTKINMVEPGSSADKAGLKAGQEIVKINGEKINSADEITLIAKENPEKALEFEVVYKDETKNIIITPKSINYFSLGIYETEEIKPNLEYAFYNTVDYIKTIFDSYIDLFKGKVKISQMSGIVGVGEVVAKTNGIIEFLKLMAILSMAIGIANILPFPPLDGGKIVIVLCEKILKRKLPEKAELIISYIGLGILVLLAIFVTYNDITRII